MSERYWQITTFVVVLGAIFFGLYQYYAPRDHLVIGSAEPELPVYDDPFLLGEYYFNHDPNYAGEAYDLQKAREYYTEAIMTDSPNNHMAWYQLGRIDFIEGKFLSALYKFDKYSEYAPLGAPSPDYMIGLVYGYKAKYSDDPGDWERAAKHFERFIEVAPIAWAPRVDLAWVYFASGKYEAMLPHLEEGLVHNPNNAWLHNMYGLALLNTDQKTKAREHFVLAEVAAAELTVADWGRAYPGNDPLVWDDGLREFQEAIAQNITLSNNQ